ncbi:MAG: CoxG family protein [Zwartia sp.]|jgi:carbon monoxide dehydrogenase subunit G
MEVVIDKQYPIPASPEQCWQVLSDVIDLATCMPGASITEKLDDTHYKGSVKVKVGPANAAFAGDIEIQGIDAALKEIRMLGKGADRGGSSASMQLTASLLALPDGSTGLVGKATVIVNGKFAQFGGRMMTSVSDMILQQFADNFSIKAQAVTLLIEQTATAQPSQSAGTEPPTIEATVSAKPAAPAVMHTELNGLAIAWMLIKNFFKGLFGKSTK